MFWDICSQVVSIEPGSDQQNNREFSLITTTFLLYKYFQYRSLTRFVFQEPEEEWIKLYLITQYGYLMTYVQTVATGLYVVIQL